MVQVDRRTDIILAAQRLFFEEGYETTSLNDITKVAGVSKGALYHYFDSKRAVLEAVAEGMILHQAALIQPFATNPNQNAIDNFNDMCNAIIESDNDNMDEVWAVASALYHPKNFRLHHQIELMQKKHVIPLVALVIAQGVEEKVFDLGATDEVSIHSSAEFIQAIMNATLDTFVRTLIDTERSEDAFEPIRLKFTAAQKSVDRILCSPSGAIKIWDEQKLEEWFA